MPPEWMLGTQQTRFNLTIRGSKIAHNTAIAGTGAGLMISPGHPLSVHLNIVDSLIQNNTFGMDEGKRPAGYTATRDPRIVWASPEGDLGGAAFVRAWSGNTTITITKSVLQDNHASAGGALYVSTKCPKLTNNYTGMGFYPEEYKVPYGVHCAAAAATVSINITSNSRLEGNTAVAEGEGSDPQAYGLNGGGGALKVVADSGNYGGSRAFAAICQVQPASCLTPALCLNPVRGHSSHPLCHAGPSCMHAPITCPPHLFPFATHRP